MPKVQLNKAKRAARRVVDAPNSPVTAPVAAEARPQHVAHLKTYLLNEKKCSPATVAKTLRTLKAAFYRAKKLGLID